MSTVRESHASAAIDPLVAVEASPVPEDLRKAVEELGLSPYEARVLLGLFRLGSANSIQLAKLTGVPRTAVYPVLEGLGAKGLAVRLPVQGPAQWASPGRDEVLQRLDAALAAAAEQRLAEHRSQSAKVRQMLEESFPEAPSVALPFVHQLHG
ncbi:MAG TPA: helix-turn-helix domain-containing protein, partial [Acidimicrobiales bacterium]|nr:helix-turn-helix domain-containing protein [Acidimicrobiales bacterium]